MKQNILLIDYFNLFKINGLTSYLNNLSAEFILKNNIQLHYIWVKSAPKTNKIIKEYLEGIVHYYVPDDLSNQLIPRSKTTGEDTLAFLCNELKGKDNIIFHFNWINHAPFAQLLKQKIPCTTILTKHCIPWRDLITNNYSLFSKLNNQFLLQNKEHQYLNPVLHREAVAYHSVDHIICVTRFAQNSLEKVLNFPKEKTTVIYNGLAPVYKKNKNSAALRTKYGLGKKEKIILFAGAVNTRKGIFDLVTALDMVVAQNENVRLIIAGSGEHSTIFTTTKSNWSKITVTGPLNKKTLYDFYEMADVGVVPSYIEQCSYSAIEMMHFGLPIIVADVDGLAEIVPDDCGLKVPLVLRKTKAHIHQKKLAESIFYFINNPVIAQQYATRAKQHALKNFTAQKMADETVAVYKKLVAPKKELFLPVAITPKSPLVTVLLPVFNGEKFLKDCIDSILQQTYTHFELLIVNDGSTDNTESVIQQYTDKRILVIKNIENEGIVKALNKGIKAAKGKYITRMDADDIMHPERLAKQVDFLENPEHETVAVLGSHQYVVNEHGYTVGLKQYPITTDEIKGSLPFQNPFSQPCVMIRSAVLKRYRYSKKYPHSEDYDLWCRISKKYQLANLPEYLTYNRVHPPEISHQQAKIHQQHAAEQAVSFLEEMGIEPSVEELTIHLAIMQRNMQPYINNKEKMQQLKNWIDKVLLSLLQQQYIHPAMRQKIRSYLLEQVCGII